MLILLLTVLTQIGGVIFLLCLGICYRMKLHHLLWKIFPPVYVLFSLLIIPNTAPFFGREEVLNTENIKQIHWLYRLANRHYVTPELNAVLQDLSKVIAPKGISIICLDANFPFMDGFPLLPHLSHNDGKKIDLSLVYENQSGEIVNLQKSRSGYGVFVAPNGDETNQTQRCKSAGYFQYDYPKYLTLGEINEGLRFSEKGTKAMVSSILNSKNVSKVFLEPHLVERLQIQHPKMRFHGCGAVRHDDHIHIQIK
jgi:hypothetical protein